MAYVQKMNEEDEQQAAVSPEKVLTQGSTGADDGQAEAQPAAGAQTTPGKQKGSGWTNLVNYANANREAGQQMAGRVAQSIQNQGTQAQQTGQTYQATANTAIEAATPKHDQSIIDDLANDPTKVTGDRATQLQAMRSAQYSGPKAAQDVAGYQDASNAYEQTAEQAEAAEDFEGRRSLIANAYGKGANTTAGESRLNSFLAGAGGGQQLADVHRAYDKNSAFQKGWGDLVSSVTGNIGKADESAKTTNAAANTALDTAVASIDKTFEGYGKQADTTNTSHTAAYTALDEQLRSSSAKTRAKAFEEIGLDAATGEWLVGQGYSLPQLVAAGKSRTAGDFASDKDVANAQALYGLKGAQMDPALLAKSGGDGSAYTKNTSAMSDASRAKGIQDAVTNRLKDAQQARDLKYSSIAGDFTGFGGPSNATLAKLGINRADYDFASEQGIDPMEWVTRGGALNYGDVTSKAERQGWANLMNSLGLDASSFDVQDTQDEGKAFTFDKGKFGGAVKTRRDAIAAEKAAAEAAARRAAEEAAAQQATAEQAAPTLDGAVDAATGSPLEQVLDAIPNPEFANPTPSGGRVGRILSDKREKTAVRAVNDDEVGAFLKSLGRNKRHG